MKDRFWIEDDTRRETTRQAVEWLREQDIEVRGHCLVWPSWRKSPAEYKTLAKDPEALRSRIDSHITDIVSTFRGRIVEWDVINEPVVNHDIIDLLGLDAAAQWFQLARATDPGPRLYLNDHQVLNGRGVNRGHLTAFMELARALVERGAPVDGIGQQAHFWNGDFTAPERLMEVLDELSSLDLPIEITELSIPHEDKELQARYLRDLTLTLFSHPRVNGILLWNFMEGRTHQPSWFLYDRLGRPTPAGFAWEDLVFKRWHTDVTLRSDEHGIIRWRGFPGEYRLTSGRKSGVAAEFRLNLRSAPGASPVIHRLEPGS